MKLPLSLSLEYVAKGKCSEASRTRALFLASERRSFLARSFSPCPSIEIGFTRSINTQGRAQERLEMTPWTIINVGVNGGGGGGMYARRFIAGARAAARASLRPLCMPFRFVSPESIKFLFMATARASGVIINRGIGRLTKCLNVITRAIMSARAYNIPRTEARFLF